MTQRTPLLSKLPKLCSAIHPGWTFSWEDNSGSLLLKASRKIRRLGADDYVFEIFQHSNEDYVRCKYWVLHHRLLAAG